MSAVAKCPKCEAANRDLGILIASVEVIPSRLTLDKVANAYARLTVWVTHVREMAGAAQAHVDGLNLQNLSRTAYVRDVEGVLNASQDATMAAMSRGLRDQVIASALVLLISGAYVWPVGPERSLSENIAAAWGWKGPRPDWPTGSRQRARL